MKKEITVFTPTYNREKTLVRLYDSLCRQTYKNFKWLLVDDGSIDNTEQLVNEWKKENVIEIVYIKQQNGGKYKAVNTGVRNCDTDLFVFIDSDDYFLDYTLEILMKEWKNVVDNDRVAAIVGRRINSKGEIVGKNINFTKQVINENLLIKKFGYIGDTCRMYRTKILKNNLYPDIEDKFIPEHVMFSPINKEYNIYFLNSPLSVSEYLENGYTKNYKELLLKNPRGHLMGLNAELISGRELRYKILKSLSYILWSWNLEMKNSFKECNNKVLYIIMFPIAIILYILKIPKWYSNERKSIYSKIFEHIKIYYYALKTLGKCDAKILSPEETVNKILKEKKNLIRFGDGEFKFFDKKGIVYQEYDGKIEEGLKNILHNYSNNSKYLLCMPKDFFECKGIKLFKNKKYLYSWAFSRYYFIKKVDYKNKVYGDSFSFAKQNKKIYKKIFETDKVNRIILVHNNVKYSESFKEIYHKKIVEFVQIPSKNSFQRIETIYKEIIEKVNNQKENTLVLISAGPTGKILVEKLGKEDVWAIDTGHCFDEPLNIMKK